MKQSHIGGGGGGGLGAANNNDNNNNNFMNAFGSGIIVNNQHQ